MANNERFIDLAVTVITHQATDAERTELDMLLASQPELRGEFARLEADARVAKNVLPLVNAMRARAGDFSADLKDRAAVVFNLARSTAYKHFLERFLEATGRILHVPWWAVHFIIYLLIWTAFILLIDVPKLYPKAGYFSFGGEQIAEFTFTVFMLFHIRQCRSIGILAAARIEDNDTRQAWLRRYLAPSYRGWMMGRKFDPTRQKSQWILGAWLVTVGLFLAYLGGQFLDYRGYLQWLLQAPSFWALHYYPYPQLIYLYATMAKVAMMVAGVGYFWWLFGIIGIASGKYPSTLNSRQREQLYFKCCQVAIRASIVISAATATWVAGHALAFGFTFWAYLYSVWLLLIYAAQVVIINNFRPREEADKSKWPSSFLKLIALDFAVPRQLAGSGRFAIALAFSPGSLAQLVTSIYNL